VLGSLPQERHQVRGVRERVGDHGTVSKRYRRHRLSVDEGDETRRREGASGVELGQPPQDSLVLSGVGTDLDA
jgi:hypothetical protein